VIGELTYYGKMSKSLEFSWMTTILIMLPLFDAFPDWFNEIDINEGLCISVGLEIY